MTVLLHLRSPAPKQTGLQVWQLIVGASVIATLLGTVVGIASTVTRYRLRRVEQRVYEIAKAQLGAEDAEGKLRQLTQLNQALHEQLSKVPQEANRIFLIRRLEQLSTSISRDFHEYTSIEQQLKPHATDPRLDPRIREVIEHTMMPLQKRRERRTIYIVVLLLALIVLTLSPIQPNDLAWRYLNALDYSWNWTADSPAWTIAIGGVVVAFVISVVSTLSTRSYAIVARMRKSRRIILGLAASLCALITLGYFSRASAMQCAPIACDQAGINVPYDPAGIFFNMATPVTGCLIVALAGLRRKLNDDANPDHSCGLIGGL